MLSSCGHGDWAPLIRVFGVMLGWLGSGAWLRSGGGKRFVKENKQEPCGHLTTASAFIDRFNMASVGKIFNPFHCLKVQGSLGTPSPQKISATIQGSPMKLCTVIVLFMVYQIHEEIFRNLSYDVTVTSLLKTMGKFGPPRNQTNYISLER